MIRVTDLVKSHGAHRILNGVTVEFARGVVTGVVGPSGSGKSTLLRCVNALETFEGGEIAVGDLKLVGGAAPAKDTLLRLRRAVGMVFQQFNLFPHMTVLGNVMSGPVHALGKPAAEAEATAKKLLDRVGLVHAQPVGRETRYRVDDRQLAKAVAQLSEVGAAWDARMRRIKAMAEQIERTQRR